MTDIIMPKMGDAMTEGKVIRWYKNAGDTVKKGEPVLEIETDKVNLDLEAEEDGVLGEHVVEPGSTVEVGGLLATLGGDGAESAPKVRSKEAAKKEPSKPAAAEKAEEKGSEKPEAAGEGEKKEAAAPAAKAGGTQREEGKQMERAGAEDDSGERVRSSPLARKMARQLGVELGGVRGSGPSGRIIAADVEGAARTGPATGKQIPFPKEAFRKPSLPPVQALQKREIPLSAMRRTIAKRLVESISSVPHFYLTVELDVTELTSLRTQLGEIDGMKASVNDFVIRAVALALRHHPNVNASFGSEAITQHGEINVGVAVATPEGLITPVIRNAQTRSIPEIAAEVRALVEKVKNRKLRPEEYQGSTITISNLGMFGVEEFTAIINPPNSAILAVGAAISKPVVLDGQVVVRERMKVTMSCDHRAIDGAAGAEFLRTLRTYIEQPLRLIV